MNEQIRFTEEELAQIKDIHKRYEEIGSNLVQLKLQLHQAEKQMKELQDYENELTRELVEVRQSEHMIAEKVNIKYGIGALDLETGNFTPKTD